MLQKIFALESGVIRGLLVAVVGLLVPIAGLFGVDTTALGAKAGPIVDGLSTLFIAAGLVYAGWARATKPNPPITDTAVAKTSERLEKEQQGGFVRVALLSMLAVVALAAAVALPGCQGTKAAYQAAESPDEVAFVVAEHYASAVKEAADIAPSAPAAAVRALQDADRRARPLVEQLKPLRDAYLATKSAADSAALQSALNQAVKAVADLVRAVKAAKAGA